MRKISTLYRPATGSSLDAIQQLSQHMPGIELVNFTEKLADASEARQANVRVGERIFVATVKHAEFPPSDEGPDEDSTPDDLGSDDKPEPPKPDSEDKPEEKSDDKPKSDKKDEPSLDGPGEGLKKPSVDEQILDVLHQIADALGAGGPSLGGPDDPGSVDVGAPGQGDTLPPPHHAPGGPPGHGAPPLPPPVERPAGPGGASFSHYDPAKAEFSVLRREAGELGNRGLIVETENVYPTHRVAKLTRTGLADIDGELIDVAEAGIALLTLVKR